eukprot:3418962-Rhodomonas_salina.2
MRVCAQGRSSADRSDRCCCRQGSVEGGEEHGGGCRERKEPRPEGRVTRQRKHKHCTIKYKRPHSLYKLYGDDGCVLDRESSGVCVIALCTFRAKGFLSRVSGADLGHVTGARSDDISQPGMHPFCVCFGGVQGYQNLSSRMNLLFENGLTEEKMVSGCELPYCAMHALWDVRYRHRLCASTVLCMRYAMSGTDIGYELLLCSTFAMRCPVLT